jgi:hypothetical protein
MCHFPKGETHLNRVSWDIYVSHYTLLNFLFMSSLVQFLHDDLGFC